MTPNFCHLKSKLFCLTFKEFHELASTPYCQPCIIKHVEIYSISFLVSREICLAHIICLYLKYPPISFGPIQNLSSQQGPF